MTEYKKISDMNTNETAQKFSEIYAKIMTARNSILETSTDPENSEDGMKLSTQGVDFAKSGKNMKNLYFQSLDRFGISMESGQIISNNEKLSLTEEMKQNIGKYMKENMLQDTMHKLVTKYRQNHPAKKARPQQAQTGGVTININGHEDVKVVKSNQRKRR